MAQLPARALLPADGFEEPIVIHPVLLELVAQDSNPARAHKGQLENLPLLVGDLPLLGAHTAFLPQNRDGATVGNPDGAQTGDTPKMLVKISASLSRAARFQVRLNQHG